MALNTWYQADGSTWWYWSHVADLGPYTGTIPVWPIHPIWFPSNVQEVDYVVGHPHPSGDPTLFRDGSYTMGGFSATYGYGTYPALNFGAYGAATTLEPGMHLFVQVYGASYPPRPSPAPVLPPQGFVPSALMGGCYGPTMEGGHLSDWTDSEPTHTPIADSMWQTSSVVFYSGVRPAANDVHDQIESQRLVWKSYDLASNLFPSGDYDTVDISKNNDLAVTTALHAFAIKNGVGSDQGYGYLPGLETSGIGWRGSDLSDTPPFLPSLLSGLQQGVDYDIIPGTTYYAQYASTHTTFTRWNDLSCRMQIAFTYYDTFNNDTTFDRAGPTSPPTGVKVQFFYTPSPGPSPAQPPLWVGDSPGTLLQEVTIEDLASHGWDRTDTFSYSQTWEQFFTLNLSEIPHQDFVLYMQLEYFHNRQVEIPDFPQPVEGPLWDHRFNLNIGAELVNSSENRGLDNPTVNNSVPKFKYWIPGTLTFHCPPGYTPRAVTVEGRWSDWQPGFVYDSANSNPYNMMSVGLHGGATLGYYAWAGVRSKSGTGTFADVAQAAFDDIRNGSFDSQHNPGVLGDLLGYENYTYSGGTHSLTNVVDGYQALSVAPSNNWLPGWSNTVFPTDSVFYNGANLLDFGPVPEANRSEFHHRSAGDVAYDIWLVDWEGTHSTWLNWTSLKLGGFNMYWNPNWPAETADVIEYVTATGVFPYIGSDGEPVTPALGPPLGYPAVDGMTPPAGYNQMRFQSNFMFPDSAGAAYSYDGNLVWIPPDDWFGSLESYPEQFSVYFAIAYGRSTFSTPDASIILFPSPPTDGGSYNFHFRPTNIGGSYFIGGNYTSPRWRYWIPGYDSTGLRMGQRDDGMTTFGHPRLTDKSSAALSNRVGGKNVYE
jgi:hypothetical protein